MAGRRSAAVASLETGELSALLARLRPVQRRGVLALAERFDALNGRAPRRSPAAHHGTLQRAIGNCAFDKPKQG